MKAKKEKKRWKPRIPVGKPTIWHKDESKYTRKRKHRDDNDTGE